MAYEIVVVGTSWGGLSALRTLIDELPQRATLPVVCVQHRHRDSNSLLTTLLQDRTVRRVAEVEDKAPIEPGMVYIAPADYHLLIDRGSFSLTVDEAVRYSRPSIDVTFESAADSYGASTIGVVLTGANADGSRGLRRIADRGGMALVQEPLTAESATMPRAAIKAVPSARVMTIADIARLIGTVVAPPNASPPSASAGEARA